MAKKTAQPLNSLQNWDSVIAERYQRGLDADTGSTRADFERQEAERQRAEEQAAANRPGVIASGLRGVKQGLTFEFGDEIEGALRSALSTKTYQQERDAVRAKDAEARETNPAAFGLGQILGSGATALVPGAGLAKLGTGLAATVARGAGAGIVAGAGASEADSVEGVVQDAATGGLVGGAGGLAFGGLSRILGGKGGLVAGAPERADRQLLTDVGDRATKRVRDKIAERGEETVAQLKEHGLDALARKPEELAPASKATLDKIGKHIGDVYKNVDEAQAELLSKGKYHLQAAKGEGKAASEAVGGYFQKVDEATNGLPLSKLSREVKRAAADRAAAGDKAGADELLAGLAKVEKGAEKGIADPPISLAKLHESHPDVAGAAKGAIDKHLQAALKRDPSIGTPEMFEKLKAVAAKAPGRAAEAEEQARMGLGLPLDKVTGAIRSVANARKKIGDTAGYSAAIREADGLASIWGKRGTFGGKAHIPSADVHQFVSGLGDRAFEGMKPGASKQLTGRIWGAVKDVLEEHVDEVAKRNPGFTRVDELRKLNRAYSILSPVEKAAAYRANLGKFSPTGIRQIAGEVSSATAGAATLATGNPLPLLLTRPGMAAAGEIGRAGTTALAKLVRASRAGEPTAQLIEQAITAGVPRGAIDAAVSASSKRVSADE